MYIYIYIYTYINWCQLDPHSYLILSFSQGVGFHHSCCLPPQERPQYYGALLHFFSFFVVKKESIVLPRWNQVYLKNMFCGCLLTPPRYFGPGPGPGLEFDIPDVKSDSIYNEFAIYFQRDLPSTREILACLWRFWRSLHRSTFNEIYFQRIYF